ncbi:MAG: flagellar FlbD family protein [Clostridiales bacterium]|nr:flagellar FlbD family protein [Clostridiales bacterium]
MIILTKLNGIQFALNCDMIETISENPDTTIFLTNGNIHIVKESMQEVIDKTIEYRRRIFTNLLKGVSE